ncbi:hypothetical protein ACQ4LE_002916 [Meloidogyne hapla]|uniref:Uncharacterized protein n=1 Tax=Meloidogyne hapla TaxID=6305 RepID=A0A1I8BBV6_MELHA
MPILSKPLLGLVRKDGNVIWKEENAIRFPKLRKMPPSFGRAVSFVLFVVMPVIVYFKAQKDYNPNSWYAKVWKYVELKNVDFLPFSTNYNKPLTPEEEQELRRRQELTPPILKKSEKEMDKLLKKLGFNF